jgi:hypothetical protein
VWGFDTEGVWPIRSCLDKLCGLVTLPQAILGILSVLSLLLVVGTHFPCGTCDRMRIHLFGEVFADYQR